MKKIIDNEYDKLTLKQYVVHEIKFFSVVILMVILSHLLAVIMVTEIENRADWFPTFFGLVSKS